MSTLMRPLKTRKGQPAYVDLLKVRQRFGFVAIWISQTNIREDAGNTKMLLNAILLNSPCTTIHSFHSSAMCFSVWKKRSAVRWLVKENMDLSRKKSPVQASTSNILLSHSLMSILYPDRRRPTCHLAVSHDSCHFRWTLKVTRTGSNSQLWCQGTHDKSHLDHRITSDRRQTNSSVKKNHAVNWWSIFLCRDAGGSLSRHRCRGLATDPPGVRFGESRKDAEILGEVFCLSQARPFWDLYRKYS